MSNNPFSENLSDDQNPYAPTSPPMAPGQTQGMVGHVHVLGILMIVQGSLVALYGVFMGVIGFLMPQFMAAAGNEPDLQDAPFTIEQMQGFFLLMYLGMGVVLLILGVLNIFAGIRVMQFRSRVLGIVAVIAGVGTLFGGCYCVPTSIGLCVYGLIILLNVPVKTAFELQTQGLTADEIRKRFASAQ